MQLIIVESPTKAKTLQGFLGSSYKVLSSYGHVRDLPKSDLGIDVEKDFEPKYIIPTKARKTIKLLKEAVKETKSTILATDEDREGEAIAWHLVRALGLGGEKEPYERIVFHEITEPAIKEALKSPRQIDINLVDAQQARRILDRLVGYKLSPFLWKKVARGLSAGRVQSVAVRLVVEREREIQAFNPQEYWTIAVKLRKSEIRPFDELRAAPRRIEGRNPTLRRTQGRPEANRGAKSETEFEALLAKIGDKILDKLEIKTKAESDKILKNLEGAEYKVLSVEKKEENKNPLPPFTTSTLQQDAFRRLHFSSKFTMNVAQKLYEMGYITYHRTDSLNLSETSLSAAKKFINENYGGNYWAGYSRRYKTKSKGAQEAHEAIRPTRPDFAPQNLGGQASPDKNGQKIYDLIWRRFIACQMAQATFDSTAVEIEAVNPKSEARNPQYVFRANGQTLKFDGYLKVYPIKFTENNLPILEKDEILELKELVPSQHFTEPPARYNEASLIKFLELNGIGRPSTYAPTLATIRERNYIEKDEQKRFKPTEIGTTVNDILVKNFPEIVDIKFTAELEEKLDKIAEDSKEWVSTIREFYEPFAKNLEKKYKEVSKKEFTEKPTGRKCPKCESPILIRLGRFGKFYACSNFPKCRYTAPLEENVLNIKCPKCQVGKIVEKRTRRRQGYGGQAKIFYGCNRFPECDFATWDKPTGELCPKCASILVETPRKQINPRTITNTCPVKSEAKDVSSFGVGVKCSSKECDYKVEK